LPYFKEIRGLSVIPQGAWSLEAFFFISRGIFLYSKSQMETMLFQPMPARTVIRQVVFNDLPEPWGVILFLDMGQFMDHDVIDHRQGRHDEFPIEGEGISR
jgi:hypothetical protein